MERFRSVCRCSSVVEIPVGRVAESVHVCECRRARWKVRGGAAVELGKTFSLFNRTSDGNDIGETVFRLHFELQS